MLDFETLKKDFISGVTQTFIAGNTVKVYENTDTKEVVIDDRFTLPVGIGLKKTIETFTKKEDREKLENLLDQVKNIKEPTAYNNWLSNLTAENVETFLTEFFRLHDKTLKEGFGFIVESIKENPEIRPLLTYHTHKEPDQKGFKDITDSLGIVIQLGFADIEKEKCRAIELDFSYYFTDKEITKDIVERQSLPEFTLTQKFIGYVFQEAKEESYKQKLKEKDKEITELKTQIEQLPLMPSFEKEKAVLLSKKFYTDIFDTAKIKAEHKDKLEYKLENGLTLRQQLNKLDFWVNGLSFTDIERYLKLFGYIQAVKRFIETNPKTNYEFYDLGNGFFRLKTLADSNFYKHFLKEKNKGKNKKGIYPRDKTALLEWLYKNQTEIDIIAEDTTGKIYLTKMRIFRFISQVEKIDNTKTIGLEINTNILQEGFKDYLEIDLSIFEEIEEILKQVRKDKNYTKYNKRDYISNYEDLIIKFYLILKTIYTREGTKTTKNGYVFNSQRLTKDNLIIRLGNLKDRVKENLIKRDRVRKTTESSKLINEFTNYLLYFIFSIAVKMEWLTDLPKLDDSGETFTFYINASKFDRKKTAETLKLLRG